MHHVMNVYGGLEVYFHSFLTSARERGQWSVSRSGHFNPPPRGMSHKWFLITLQKQKYSIMTLSTYCS